MPRTPKLHFIENFSEGDNDLQLNAMRKVFEFTTPEEADVFLFASFFKTREATSLISQYDKPLAVYCWDYYQWVHEHRTPSWVEYAEIMKRADVVMVPSYEQQTALKDLLGIDSVVVKSGILTYDHEITDEGFILDPLRYYPLPECQWAEQAAKELNIPIIHSEHQFTLEKFRKLVASCSFMTNCAREASTGALTISEGLWLGKPTLLSDSPYQGGRSYVGDFGHYFSAHDYNDFKNKMEQMWIERPKVDTKKAREYMSKELTFEAMAEGMRKAICDFI